MKQVQSIPTRASLYIFYSLLAYMPLHILLSTWLGTSFGVLAVAKIAKDVVLFMGFLLALSASLKQDWFKEFIKNNIVLLIGAYAALTVLLALLMPTDADAEALGVVYNLRFFVFFLYAAMLGRLYPSSEVRRGALKTVLAAGGVVIAFGIAQYLWLPSDALGSVGYSRANGVLPAFFIDDKADLERIMSTIRDPNSLGSYLIIIGSLALTLVTSIKSKKPKLLSTTYYLLTLAALFFTFSRSAWLGMALAVAVFAGLSGQIYVKAFLRHRLKAVAAASTILLVISVGTFYQLRDSYFVQNVIFHADESTQAEDPNELRLRFWRESVVDIAGGPLGSGPGTAGLVSIRNEVQGTELNENYYLQVASEVGVIGLGLFAAILLGVGRALYRQVQGGDIWAIALLASFIGLGLTNFLVHIWSNEAVAYTWWGLAGVVATLKTYKRFSNNSTNIK